VFVELSQTAARCRQSMPGGECLAAAGAYPAEVRRFPRKGCATDPRQRL